MGQVTVRVNGRDYRVSCDDGEEDHVTYLGQYVDKRVGDLIDAVGQVGEERLLLMAALLVSDDLADAYEEIEALKARLRSVEAKAGSASDGDIAELAARIEKVAARLETA